MKTQNMTKWPWNEFPEDTSTWKECTKQHALLLERLEAQNDILEMLISRIDKHMDYGERECPLCFHHYNHDEKCLYLDAKSHLAVATDEHEARL